MKSISRFRFFSVFLFSIILAFVASAAFAGEWIVKSGDNLSSIAANYPGVTAGEICKANSYMFKVKDCNHIEPGWFLVIPEVGDCFDATMTVANKQKVLDDWSRRTVSNYQDGKSDCNFKDLLKKPDPVPVVDPVPTPVVVNFTTTNEELLERIYLLENALTDHINAKTEVFVFAALGDNEVFGVGGLFKHSSDYLLSYQFSDGKDGYANELLFGKYFSSDFAFAVGPRMENDSNDNSDALGLKMAILYTPKITDSIFGFVEVGVSGMRVRESQINGTPDLTLDGNTLAINTNVLREKDSYWDKDFGFSVGVAYKF